MNGKNEVKEEKAQEYFQPYIYHHNDLYYPQEQPIQWNYHPGSYPAYNNMPQLLPFCNYYCLPHQQETECRRSSTPNQGTLPEVKLENSDDLVEKIKQQKVSVDKWRQKFGRNILSNIFHMAIKKIASSDFSQLTGKVIDKNRMSIKQSQFRNKLEQKGKQTNGYINVKNIKKLLIGNPIGAIKADIDFRKLLRILIRHYLHYYHVPHIYHSGKIKKESRMLHMQAVRKLALKLSRS